MGGAARAAPAGLGERPARLGATLEEERALPDAEWRARAAEGGGEKLFAVAEDEAGGAWLGMVGGRRLETGEWEVISLWSAPEARGRGVGEALIRFACAWAAEAGASRVVLWYVTGNDGAVRVYERCGFAHEGEPTQGRRDPSRWFRKMSRNV